MEVVLQNYHTPSISIHFPTRHSHTVNSVGLDPFRTNVTTVQQGSITVAWQTVWQTNILRHCFQEGTGYGLERIACVTGDEEERQGEMIVSRTLQMSSF